MLRSILISLTATASYHIPGTLGRPSQAWFLNQIMLKKPRLAEALHDENGSKPFTVSTLLDANGHPIKAEDMLQEGFIKVFSQMHQYRNEGALEGWIRRIVVHTCINNLKKNKKFSDSIDITNAHSIHIREEMIPSIMQAKQVVECIRSLPLGYKTVLNLYAIEGYSHK